MAEPNRKLPPLTQQDIERFWSKVDRNGPVPEHRPELGPCWVWTAGTFDSPHNCYGAFKVRGRMLRANRVAYFLGTGNDPVGLLVCHRCDRPLCTNPAHLFLGTVKDNAEDCQRKGRLNTPAGDRHGTHTRPESVQRGDGHWTHRRPAKVKRGSDNPMAKLNADQVREIRRLYAAGGISHSRLGERFGVCGSAISLIIQRKNWPDLPD